MRRTGFDRGSKEFQGDNVGNLSQYHIDDTQFLAQWPALQTKEPRRLLHCSTIWPLSNYAASVSQQFLFVLVFVELLQEAVDIFLLQIVGRGETELARVTAADTDFVRLPHPVLEIQANDWRNVHCNDRAAKGRIWGSPGFSAALDHFHEHVVSQSTMAAFDPVNSDIVGELDRGAQPPQRGDVRAADSLEALGAKLGLVPAFGGDGVPQAVDDFVAYVEKAGALWSHQPLMLTCWIHFAANVVYVETH